jgi:hypothetical protein
VSAGPHYQEEPMGWGRRAAAWLIPLANMYPDLKSSANFLDLQQNLAATEDKLFMAGAAGVSQREYYKVPQ